MWGLKYISCVKCLLVKRDMSCLLLNLCILLFLLPHKKYLLPELAPPDWLGTLFALLQVEILVEVVVG